MTRLLGIAGKQRAGKDTSINYIVGCELARLELVKRFDIDDDGGLLVNSIYVEADGNTVEDMGLIDLQRRDQDFVDYVERQFWPHVKNYYFAEPLKQIAMGLYGLTFEQVYGTTECKNSLTKHQWKNIAPVIPKELRPTKFKNDNYLSSRQFLQYLGDILRQVDDACFTNVILKQISLEQSAFALIGDVRRELEVDSIREAGGKVILLTRQVNEDTHRTEKELDSIDRSKFDAVIDNQNMTINERNRELYSILNSWGWIK